MKIYLCSIILLLCSLQCAICDEAEIKKKQLNDVMAARAGIMVEAHKVEEKLTKAWSDKSYTSPEIEKLRKRYQTLRFEMIEVREKLKSEVKQLPAVQKEAQKVDVMRIKQKDLEKQIKKLME